MNAGVTSSEPAIKPENLESLLAIRVKKYSERRAYTFLVDGESREEYLTYGQLQMAALSLAVKLRQITRDLLPSNAPGFG